MKYMDIDCYERGCACASSSRVAGEDSEVVEVVKYRELSDDEILEELFIPKSEWDGYKAQVCLKQVRAILKKASEK
jgi:hypothetical protein